MTRRAALPYALAAALALAAHGALLAVAWDDSPRARIQAQGVTGVEIRLAAAPAEAHLEPEHAPEPEPEPEITPERPAPPDMPQPSPPTAPARAQKTAPAQRGAGAQPPAASQGAAQTQQAASAATAPEPLDTLENKSPPYPELARRRGQSGEVILKATINEAGLPLEVLVSSGSGHSLLDRAALEAVRGWRFRPARLDGKAVPGEALVSIEFRLE